MLDLDQRAKIVYLLGAGKSLSEISSETSIALTTVKFWAKRWNKFKTIKNNKSTGRPNLIKGEKKQEMLKIVDDNCKLLNGEIRDKLNVNCHASTISRSLKKEGIEAFRAIKKPQLFSHHKQARLNYAKKLVENVDLNKIVFSDEKSIRPDSCPGVVWVKRKRGAEDNEKFYTPVNARGFTINLWSYVTKDGLGPLYWVSNHYNWKLYRQTLSDAIPDLIEKHNGEKFYWQQDNAPHHKKQEIKIFLEGMGKLGNFEVLDHSARSPDLNILEECWRELERRLAIKKKEFGTPTSKEAFFLMAQETWMEIPQAFIDKLYLSFYERLLVVIEREGGSTKK